MISANESTVFLLVWTNARSPLCHLAGPGIRPAALLGVGLERARLPLLAEECLRTAAGVFTGVLCWDDGVEEARPSIIELDMEELSESVMECGPELRRGVEPASLVRSEELERGSWRREDWCSWTLLRIRLSFLSCSVSWLGSRGQV